MQKLMDVIYEDGEGDCGKNEAKKASASTKKPIGADYPSNNQVNHTISNLFSKNVSKYLTPDAKKPFN